MQSARPTLFIGSSSESLDIAYAAQNNLRDVAESVVWTQGIFELTKSYLESLMDQLDDSEFGLFVFGSDDVTKIRGAEKKTVRDNVIFELGLFIGRLGREHTFIIAAEQTVDFHLPTDLLGVKTASFKPPSKPERMEAALGPGCNDIRRAIAKQVGSKKEQIVSANADSDMILPLLIPEAERQHLLNIAKGKTQQYLGGGSLRSELRHLRSIGLIKKHSGRHIGGINSGQTHDLADFVELTPLGRQWAAKLEK